MSLSPVKASGLTRSDLVTELVEALAQLEFTLISNRNILISHAPRDNHSPDMHTSADRARIGLVAIFALVLQPGPQKLSWQGRNYKKNLDIHEKFCLIIVLKIAVEPKW